MPQIIEKLNFHYVSFYIEKEFFIFLSAIDLYIFQIMLVKLQNVHLLNR